ASEFVGSASKFVNTLGKGPGTVGGNLELVSKGVEAQKDVFQVGAREFVAQRGGSCANDVVRDRFVHQPGPRRDRHLDQRLVRIGVLVGRGGCRFGKLRRNRHHGPVFTGFQTLARQVLVRHHPVIVLHLALDALQALPLHQGGGPLASKGRKLALQFHRFIIVDDGGNDAVDVPLRVSQGGGERARGEQRHENRDDQYDKAARVFQ